MKLQKTRKQIFLEVSCFAIVVPHLPHARTADLGTWGSKACPPVTNQHGLEKPLATNRVII